MSLGSTQFGFGSFDSLTSPLFNSQYTNNQNTLPNWNNNNANTYGLPSFGIDDQKGPLNNANNPTYSNPSVYDSSFGYNLMFNNINNYGNATVSTRQNAKLKEFWKDFRRVFFWLVPYLVFDVDVLIYCSQIEYLEMALQKLGMTSTEATLVALLLQIPDYNALARGELKLRKWYHVIFTHDIFLAYLRQAGVYDVAVLIIHLLLDKIQIQQTLRKKEKLQPVLVDA